MSSLCPLIVAAVKFGVNCFSNWRHKKIDKFRNCCESFEKVKSKITISGGGKKTSRVGDAALIFLARKLCTDFGEPDEETIEKHYNIIYRDPRNRMSAMRKGLDPSLACWDDAQKRALKEGVRYPSGSSEQMIPKELYQYRDAFRRVVFAAGDLHKKEQLQVIDCLRDSLTQADLFWVFIFQSNESEDFKKIVFDLSLLKHMRTDSLHLPQLKWAALQDQMNIPTRARDRDTASVSRNHSSSPP